MNPSGHDSWNFAIVGRDSSGVPKFIGWANTKEEAEQLRKSAETVGWHKVAIYDADLTERGSATGFPAKQQLPSA